MKRLYRSKKDRKFSGVIGGIGEYTNTDPNLLRIIFVLLVLMTGVFPMVIAYIMASFFLPENPNE
ncbi:MAG: hypothetical protein CO137_02085 [Candidatus Magasanikbacteria bacterium CG_4_9_14_3_um_filter_32_9]|uniref:Phage shock protein PspC N-terminal domain-containing protein n=1 Tax=Candidatus Magasanikbacteria bacterium CG_4_9_14_3_um_filter_32_9 TaxID=1974644 RepID=A0A2M7Z6U1_9BACT|nr:MAG: hypothetical protein CO137_02085 [Candidatus Magasanikbacteria bacterium CG_4_9_14_3_um_filter_32_9]